MDSSKSPKSLSWWLALAITLLTALVGYLSTSCSLTRSAHYQVDSISAKGVLIDKNFGSEIKK